MEKTNSANIETAITDNIMERVVLVSVEYLSKALKVTGTQVKPQSLRLEEIDGGVNSARWTLTLSYIDASTENPLSLLYNNNSGERIYKDIVVEVDGNNYNVVSIKERVGNK